MKLSIYDMDPDKTAKDSRYAKDFTLTVIVAILQIIHYCVVKKLTFNRIDHTDKKMVEDVKEEQRFMDIIDEIMKVPWTTPTKTN